MVRNILWREKMSESDQMLKLLLEDMLQRRKNDQSTLDEIERLRAEVGKYKNMCEETYSTLQDVSKENQELGKKNQELGKVNDELWELVEKHTEEKNEAEKKKKEELQAKEKSKLPNFLDNYSPQRMDLETIKHMVRYGDPGSMKGDDLLVDMLGASSTANNSTLSGSQLFKKYRNAKVVFPTVHEQGELTVLVSHGFFTSKNSEVRVYNQYNTPVMVSLTNWEGAVTGKFDRGHYHAEARFKNKWVKSSSIELRYKTSSTVIYEKKGLNYGSRTYGVDIGVTMDRPKRCLLLNDYQVLVLEDSGYNGSKITVPHGEFKLILQGKPDRVVPIAHEPMATRIDVDVSNQYMFKIIYIGSSGFAVATQEGELGTIK
jgi:hypothetical protein